MKKNYVTIGFMNCFTLKIDTEEILFETWDFWVNKKTELAKCFLFWSAVMEMDYPFLKEEKTEVEILNFCREKKQNFFTLQKTELEMSFEYEKNNNNIEDVKVVFEYWKNVIEELENELKDEHFFKEVNHNFMKVLFMYFDDLKDTNKWLYDLTRSRF